MMTPKTFAIELTEHEIAVVINLMRAGARSMPEAQYDDANASYLTLRNKLLGPVVEAQQAEASNVVPMPDKDEPKGATKKKASA